VQDLGQSLIDHVYKRLQIDEEWSSKANRSFSWIAHRLEQTVSASPGIQEGDFELFRLRAEAVVIEDVRASQATVDCILSDLNRFSFGSCYSFLPAEKRIYATTSTWVHQDTAGWRTDIFDAYAIGQLCFAETEADFLAEKCEGVVAVRAHARSGQRLQPDDMLNAVDAKLALQGIEPCRFKNAFEFESVAEVAMRSENVASLGGSANGLALECSFDDYTAIAILSPNERHRRLGNGLSVRLQLPTPITPVEGYRIAATLNRHERDDGPITTHTGAWCLDVGPMKNLAVTYRSFLPNILYLDGLIMDASTNCIARMKWADRTMNAKPASESVWKRLASRFGVGAREACVKRHQELTPGRH